MKRLFRRPALLILIGLTLMPGAAIVAGAFPSLSLGRLTEAKLGGVTQAAPLPAWSPSAFLSGQFQKETALWLNERMGKPREIMIRLNNGVGYWMGRSFNPNVLIGRDGVLFPENYVREWCNPAKRRNRGEPQAATIARVRDLVETSGRTFVLIFSPSKPAIYPEYLWPACQGDSPTRYFNQLKEALQKYRINIVDGNEIMKRAKTTESLSLFARDGLHWTEQGASYVVDAVMTSVESQMKKPLRHLKIKDIKVNDRPVPADEDLGDLLNLPFRLMPYPSTHVTFEVDTEPESPRILMVGTSFSWALLDLIGRQRLSDDVTFYFYFSRIARFAEGQPQSSEQSFAAEGDLSSALKKADVVLLEVNEANIFSQHIESFAKALAKLKP